MAAMLHGRNNRFLFAMGKTFSFPCKTFSLFLPYNMAAMLNLYQWDIDTSYM